THFSYERRQQAAKETGREFSTHVITPSIRTVVKTEGLSVSLRETATGHEIIITSNHLPASYPTLTIEASGAAPTFSSPAREAEFYSREAADAIRQINLGRYTGPARTTTEQLHPRAALTDQRFNVAEYDGSQVTPLAAGTRTSTSRSMNG